MKVLGIDPGFGRCGVAVVEKSGGPSTSLETRKEVLLYSGCIETDAKDDFPSRLAQVARECARLIKTFVPDCVALEKLYFSTNQRTAMQVAEVRGALIQVASEAGLVVAEYTPAQVKSAVASSGRADKKQVAAMLHLLMKIDKKIRHDDEYDAIAIAVTHLARSR